MLPSPIRAASRQRCAVAVMLCCAFLFPASGAVIEKANNTNALNLSTSWVGGADTVQWSGMVTGAATAALGTNLTWAALKILNPGGPVGITGPHELTLASSGTGLDLALATQDLTLGCDIALGANQSWNVTNSRTVSFSGDLAGTGRTLTKDGAGSLLLNGGTKTVGTLDVNAGKVQLTAGTLNTAGGSGAYGYLIVSGGGTFEQTGGTYSSPGYVTVGQSGGGPVLDLKGGSFNAAVDLMVGYAAAGTLNISGTANVTAGTLRFGQAAVKVNGNLVLGDKSCSPALAG